MKLLKFKGAAFLRLRHEPNQAKPNWHADLNGQRVVIDFISTFINLQKTSDYVLRITVASIWIGGKWLRWRPMPFMACLDELWSERTMATWMRRMLSRLFFVWSWWWSVYGVLYPSLALGSSCVFSWFDDPACALSRTRKYLIYLISIWDWIRIWSIGLDFFKIKLVNAS